MHVVEPHLLLRQIQQEQARREAARSHHVRELRLLARTARRQTWARRRARVWSGALSPAPQPGVCCA